MCIRDRAGIIGLVGISIAAVFLISTSIRITVFSRREEIDIMRLVGATNWYIRWPFLIEGVFIGVIGALLACVLPVSYTHLDVYKRQVLRPLTPGLFKFLPKETKGYKNDAILMALRWCPVAK